MSGADHAGVRIPPPPIFLAGLAVGGSIEIAAPTADLPLGVAVAVGVAGAAIWVALDVRATMLFRRAGTRPLPWTPTEALVTSGPFRLTRNPMYLGMAVLYVGLALAFGLLWALVVLPVVLLAVDRLVIVREERYLERAFGEDYRAYRRRVRRWI
jgi:protein-S-isoprenylcysteine O-methyltransferase Ste14